MFQTATIIEFLHFPQSNSEEFTHRPTFFSLRLPNLSLEMTNDIGPKKKIALSHEKLTSDNVVLILFAIFFSVREQSNMRIVKNMDAKSGYHLLITRTRRSKASRKLL